MRQFKTWTNNMEKEPVKVKEEKINIQKVEYRNTDRMEKTIVCATLKSSMPVTKGYFERSRDNLNEFIPHEYNTVLEIGCGSGLGISKFGGNSTCTGSCTLKSGLPSWCGL